MAPSAARLGTAAEAGLGMVAASASEGGVSTPAGAGGGASIAAPWAETEVHP